jgi:hypothetical protein
MPIPSIKNEMLYEKIAKKKKKAKRARSTAQVVEHLPSKHVTLSPNPRTIKKERTEERLEKVIKGVNLTKSYSMHACACHNEIPSYN